VIRYFDSNFVALIPEKSIFCYIFMLTSGVISWSSLTTTSTTEIELFVVFRRPDLILCMIENFYIWV